MQRPWLVTATPPTPNGELHLGHLSGPYLAGDIFSRHQRRLSGSVTYLTGIDDNQSYTELRALRDGRSPQETADHFGDRIERGWRDAGIHFDLIARPRLSPHHREFTRAIFQDLYDKGHILPRTRPLPYCDSCDRWAFEAFVVGSCPHCGTRACGNACEVCGRPNDCADLGDPHCTLCGSACVPRDCTRLYLPLEHHRPVLESFWREVGMNGHLTALCDDMQTAGLPEIAVSHPADWGVEVPVEGFSDHRVYVWFEMAAGYLAATQEHLDRNGAGRWQDVWHSGERIVQFFGFDNGYFHAVLFPAVMSAHDPRITLPNTFVSNEFYRLDGEKFSTSRQHAIWLLDALRDTPADHLRIHLSWTRPSTRQTSFTRQDFAAHLHGDRLPRWYGWLEDLTRRAEQANAEQANAPQEAVQDDDDRRGNTGRLLRARVADVLHLVDTAYSAEEFSPRTVLDLLDMIVDDAQEAGRDGDHLLGRPGLREAYLDCVAAQLSAAAAFAVGLHPIAPQMAQQIWSALELAGSVESLPWEDALSGVTVPNKVGNLAHACTLFIPE
ncbi:class I tRNA ligase family protein [Streptosporangium algeriense]|uniref:Class I tRNA ligase family protein n=1 Tax=Streptosporangium algeriense TaxID=1682748 RepID=A0ABW3DJH0_9ACTN